MNFLTITWYLMKPRLQYPLSLFWIITFPIIMYGVSQQLTYWVSFIILSTVLYSFLDNLYLYKDGGILKSLCSTKQQFWKFVLALFCSGFSIAMLSILILFLAATMFFNLHVSAITGLKITIVITVIFILYSMLLSFILLIGKYSLDTGSILTIILVMFSVTTNLPNTPFLNAIQPINLLYLCSKILNYIIFNKPLNQGDKIVMILLPFISILCLYLFNKNFTLMSKLKR